MSNGTYGTVKPAFITEKDVDIYYFYRPTRSSESPDFSSFKKLDSSILSQTTFTDASSNISDNTLPGMYNMRLPLDVFSEKGFYTIYIKPKEIRTVISDVSVLAAYPDIRGIVINKSNIIVDDESIFNNGNLVGYRIEYFDNAKRQNYYRIITSNNKCEPVSQNLNDSNQKSVRYRYNDSSDLIFCTVTPSLSTSFKSNALPFIGKTSQEIVLINTKFNPIMMEIEMAEHDIETVSTMLENNQLRDLDNGLITTYNDNNEIYHQTEYSTLKDSYNGKAVYEVKRKRTDNIDFTQDYNSIVGE